MKLNSIIDLALSSSVLSEVVLDDGRISRNDLAVTPAISGLSYVDYDASDVGDIAFKLNSILAAFKGDPQPTPPGPVQEFDLSVGCEYRGLEPEPQFDAKLFVDGVETAFGSVIRRPAGTVVRLEAAIEGDDAHTVGCAGWSDGSTSSAIDFVISADSELTAVFARFGTEENPWRIGSVNDLMNLKAAVEGTASEENPYRAGHYYKQTADIDMEGEEWTGIGLLKNAYNADTAHAFTGSYDGNGHSITNLKLKVDESASDPTNRYLSLFRAVSGATIKNLTVDVAGFDGMASDDVTGAAIIGMVDGGATLENCTATGFLGTSETPVVHMTGGVICRVVTPEGGSAYDTPLTLTNVTNKVNVTCARKCGGIIANGVGKIIMTNVVNEGNITKTGTKSGDQVGGLIGYNDENVHVRFEFNGIKNTGTISSAGGPSYGQLMGCWQVETGTQTNNGDIAIADSNMPASTRCPTKGSDIVNDFPIYFGELGTDGLLHGVNQLEDGKAYVYMVGNINEKTGAVGTPPAYVLPNGATITVEHRFGGTPNITDSGNNPIAGESVGGNVYRYSA